MEGVDFLMEWSGKVSLNKGQLKIKMIKLKEISLVPDER